MGSFLIVRMLWEVSFADGHAGSHEQHLVRKVAGLLHVPHRDFIRMKLQQDTSSDSAVLHPGYMNCCFTDEKKRGHIRAPFSYIHTACFRPFLSGP
jgi:hypothetical protein